MLVPALALSAPPAASHLVCLHHHSHVCCRRLEFRAVGRPISKGDAGMWQARVREALGQWQQLESEGGFVLR